MIDKNHIQSKGKSYQYRNISIRKGYCRQWDTYPHHNKKDSYAMDIMTYPKHTSLYIIYD